MIDSLRAAFFSLLAMLGLGAPGAATYQGYGEGEYVLVASPIAGTLESLDVARGQTIHKGDTLFALEHVSEQDAVDQAKAAVSQAEAARQIAETNYARDRRQIKAQAISQAALDADKAILDQARAQQAQTEAALASTQWKLDQKKRSAPSDAYVFDTLYRAGEFVKEGQPVVSLLPAANIKVRFFVPATALSEIAAGTAVKINGSGRDEPIPGHVTYISPQAEYSPPELYNRDNREKLLFMCEAVPDTTPERIHPGLPVDVTVEAK